MRFMKGWSREKRKAATVGAKTFCRETDFTEVGIAAFYGYFAVNILMKSFGYDHGDGVYKCFMFFAILFLAVKVFATRYTMREVMWSALLLGLGLLLGVVNKHGTWLLMFATVIGMKNVSFRRLVKLTIGIRVFCLIVMVIGSVFGVFDIGYTTVPDVHFRDVPVYSFGMKIPNTAFQTVFIVLVLPLYDHYKKLNVWWFVGTSAAALLFYRLTFCRTGIVVFFFCWALILFEKLVKREKAKFIFVLSVPVGVVFSLVMMMVYDAGNPIMGKINHIVTGRVYIMNGFYEKIGLSLIPRTQELFYANYYGLIDNVYMFILLYCGWIVALFVFYIVMKTLLALYKRGCYKELVMISAMALYGVLEQFVMNGFMNTFILLCAGLLYPQFFDTIDEERA